MEIHRHNADPFQLTAKDLVIGDVFETEDRDKAIYLVISRYRTAVDAVDLAFNAGIRQFDNNVMVVHLDASIHIAGPNQ